MTRAHPTRWVPSALFAALMTITGCGGAPPSTAASSSGTITDLCAVITRPEAITALGKDPGAPIPFTNGCKYGQDTDPQTLRVTVGTGPESSRAFDGVRKQAQDKVADGEDVFKDLSGVGDAAFLSYGLSNGAVFILKGTTMAQIGVGGFVKGGVPSEVILTTLARHAAPRLSGATAAAPTAAPPGAAKATETCSLITQQEATAALGKDPGPGTAAGKADTGFACSYGIPTGGYLQAGYNPSITRALFDDGKQKAKDAYVNVPNGSFVDIAGLGDTAFVASAPNGGACEFLKGTVLGHVTLVSQTALPAPADTLTRLCRLLVGRV